MVAKDSYPPSQPPIPSGDEALAPADLRTRMDEEISRAERQGTGLSCLLLVIENLEEMAREHGSELPEQTLTYVAGALRGELRSFDRIGRPSGGELLIVLPGADGPRAEIVARRVIERLQTIKVEARGERSPLQISLGLAAWRAEMSAADLLARARQATRRQNGDAGQPPPPSAPTPTAEGPRGDPRRAGRRLWSALGRPASS